MAKRILQNINVFNENKSFLIEGKFCKIIKLEEEWYEDINNPNEIIKQIKKNNIKTDIFSFWQRIPETVPKYNYYYEKEEIAVLPIKTYDYWWKHQIKSRTRGLINKSKKKGLEVRTEQYNKKFIEGIVSIFNETTIRQGRPYWHYGKDYNTVKREFSRYLFRETLIGAYYNDELVGFIMLADAGNFALTGQIISKIAHRDKAPNNALIAKAVEICEEKKIQYLVYFFWGSGNFSEFKRRCGFEKVCVPRYYIPLTYLGKLTLKLKLQHGIKGIIPEVIISYLKKYREAWYKKTIST